MSDAGRRAAANGRATPGRLRFPWLLIALSLAVFAVLVSLGNWQVRRLAWKEGLLATIDQRIHATPVPLADVEKLFAATGDVDYVKANATGTFLNGSERHFFATHDGATGYYVYTPLRLADGRYLFVNRGFVPYDLKEPAKRAAGEIAGTISVTGLARNPLPAKPSAMLPDNEPAKDIFYWKELPLMASTAGLPAGAAVLPFFLDADATPNPGGLPVGGVTIIDLPNSHLQYAVTWYGLAAALAAVVAAWLWRWRRGTAALAGVSHMDRPPHRLATLGTSPPNDGGEESKS